MILLRTYIEAIGLLILQRFYIKQEELINSYFTIHYSFVQQGLFIEYISLSYTANGEE